MVGAVREIKQEEGIRGRDTGRNFNSAVREGLIELGPSELRHEGGKR